jgi:hypothetical protein
MRAMSIFRVTAVCSALASLVALTTGCPVLDVEANVDEVCVTYSGLSIPGVPIGSGTVSQSFPVTDLGQIQDLTKYNAQLQFVKAEVRPVSGVSDLSFVQAAHVSIASGAPSSTLPTIDVYDCDGDCDGASGALTVPATNGNSAVAYVESGSVIVDLEVTGTLPTADWTVDVDVCFSGHAAYKASL